MEKIKVLLIQNKITHYNLPIYNLLGKKPEIDLTIAHFDTNPVKKEKEFNEILLHSWSIGSIIFSKENIYLICNQFEVVICMADIHWISLMFLGLKRRRKFKLIYWGIGVSASYKNKFNQNNKWDFLRFYLMKGANALVFYSDFPIEKYIKHGFRREKLFVAHNTVEVKRTLNCENSKETILFVGSLYKEKGVYDLLAAYKSAYSIVGELPQLDIIGDGEEFGKINYWIKKNGLNHAIKLHGAIYDDILLEKFFLKAIATISPNQAGLSVLKSMAYGVPFITMFDSITGGERLNIINNKTGIIYNTKRELINILCTIGKRKGEYKIMGENAFRFYNEHRLPEHMVKGFLDAIYFIS